MIITDAVVALLLSPLLLYQAINLRKRALRLPEASGPRKDVIGNGAPLRLLIIGDSSAAGVGVDHQNDAIAGRLSEALSAEYTVHWHLSACTGATTPTTLTRLQSEDLSAADVVLVILGVNDVTHGGSQAAWLRCHATLRAVLRKRTGAQKLYVCQIPPLGAFPLLPNPLRWLLGRRATRFDIALHDALDLEPDTAYSPLPDMLTAADMAIDGFHPGPRIYAAWAKELARRIFSDGPIK